MDKKELESKKLPDLRTIAKSIGLEKVESLKKAELISQIINGNSNSPETLNNDKQELNESIQQTLKLLLKKPKEEEL